MKDQSLVASSRQRIPHHNTIQKIKTRPSCSSTTSTTSLKRWPKPTIESSGDYRTETHLEQTIGGPLYTAQPNLPRLPIPSIAQTITKFLPTALPLAKTEEETQSLQDACDKFPEQAAVLQRRLEERDGGVEMKNTSWLQEWWNTEGYLRVRDPLVVNVSYFFHFSDDGTLSSSSLVDAVESSKSLGVKRGAAILVATAEYRKLVCSGSLPHDSIGRREPKTPLCSVAFKYMFNACRIPRRGQDTYKMYDPSQHRHCIVSCRGQFFAVDFVDGDGNPLPLSIIEDRLQRCVVEAEMIGGGEVENSGVTNLGWLTSNDRDSWADARAELLRIGGRKMVAALEKLESGAMMLCLDNEEPISREQCANTFWTGGLSSGGNRWFDKSIQVMCTKNGKAGLIGEHSMMDGMPMIGYADYITKRKYADVEKTTSKHLPSSSQTHDSVQNIFQDCISDINLGDSKIDNMIHQAKTAFAKLIGDHSLDVQSFQGYGSNYIKKMGYSPDAYVQMAIQLAIYRLFKEQAGTYEASQMRPFLHGRTETTRTVSPASEVFVKRMGFRAQFDENDAGAREEKLSLLHAATDSHVKYLVGAGKGSGVDRHFFGLSMMVKDGEKAPELLSNPLFIRSKTWRVSTSHLTHPNFDNWGYGEVVENGVGLAYAVKSGSCIFNITAREEHGWTEQLSHLLEEALIEMQLLNDMNQLNSKL
eukprot:CAMPEP_0198260534 /NCGR_PEP_ID=MMETSP1447-20131203/9492_1 /TAXON_ID=420782 /ORGANISM="Chaetoceros dichaeta, Strain CCMP1751" /LENGTH=700 /DNA_ID=CAMNT_0043948229 /DNA_START=186 /DNA_END=2288 /DNA_ORIENTATION=-